MPDPVRVLHLAAGNLFGGVETMLCTLASRGRTVLDSEFGLCYAGRLSRELERRGAAVHVLGEVRFRRPLSLGFANLALARRLRSGRYDAVVTHGAWPHLAFGPCVRACGVRLVAWGHDAPSSWTRLDRLAQRVRPDLLIANSQHTRRVLGDRFKATRTEVIYAPVESHMGAGRARASIRRELATPESALVIAFAARLERWKGHDLLLAAASELARSLQADFRIWLCGGPQRAHEHEYFRELMQLAERAGLSSRISFLGERSDVPELFRAADIFCQPNRTPEPFGIVFVEALYAGLPIVATDMGGAREIVDPSCGLLVAPEPASIARALARLIDEPSLRRTLAQAAPARASSLCDPESQTACIARAIAG
jgi:glycosyltransferase involved in cell wall biosynthesis